MWLYASPVSTKGVGLFFFSFKKKYCVLEILEFKNAIFCQLKSDRNSEFWKFKKVPRDNSEIDVMSKFGRYGMKIAISSSTDKNKQGLFP